MKDLAVKKLENIDKPNFKDCKGKSPVTTLECKITEKEKIEKIKSLVNKKEAKNVESKHFLNNTFGIFFTDGCLKNGLKRNSYNTNKQYCDFIEGKFADSEIYGIYGIDESSGRLEIRLFLQKYNYMILCSVEQVGNALKCFSVIERNSNEIKDMDRAVKLDCKFKVDSKATENCYNASLLIEFLKEDFDKHDKNKKQNQIKKEILCLKTSLELQEQDEKKGGIAIIKPKFYVEIGSNKGWDNKLEQEISDFENFEKSLNISLNPNIVFYTENALTDNDLESNGERLGHSKFFTTLFKLLDFDI